MPPSPRMRVTAAALVSLGAVSSCEGDLIGDPSFDLWCGDTLCGWEVELGEVRPVATWHHADKGAELVGGIVAISQASDADDGAASCIRFSLTADVDAGAQLSIEVDFQDDGTVEVSHPMQSDDYREVTYTIATPERWEGVRFRVRKLGEARAVLGQVRAQAVDDVECPGEPLPTTDLPQGAACDGDSQCASDICSTVPLVSSFGDPASLSTCGGCDRDSDCAGDDICGLDWGDDDYFGHRACAAPAGDRPLGVACSAEVECSSGTCADGQCATCAADADCGGGDCRRHDAGTGDADPSIMPRFCDPGDGLRVAGEACLADADCASGDCASTTPASICNPDGRPCETDADCPFTDLGGACVFIGPADGQCR